MRKILAVLLAGLLAATTLSALAAGEPQEEKKKPGASADQRWKGIIVVISKDKSSLTVSEAGTEKTIYYDSSTQWIKEGKPADQSEFKEGRNVRIRGKIDENGRFVATKITLEPTPPK